MNKTHENQKAIEAITFEQIKKLTETHEDLDLWQALVEQ